jgi:hypothetical protein
MKKVVWLTLLLVALIPTISLAACDPLPPGATDCAGCGNKSRTRIVSFSYAASPPCSLIVTTSYGNCGACAI